MGTTRIFVTTNKTEADQTAGFWSNLPDGYKVIGIGPTAKIEVSPAGDGNALWQSSGNGPWFGVLVTKPDVAAAGGGGAAGGAGGAGGGAGGAAGAGNAAGGAAGGGTAGDGAADGGAGEVGDGEP